MGKKQFQCNACGQKHEKPIDDECQFVDSTQEEGSEGSDIQLAQAVKDDDTASDISDTVGNKILDKRIDMDNRLKVLEQCNKDSDKTACSTSFTSTVSRRGPASAASASRPATTVVKDSFGIIIPDLHVLSSPQVQRLVDDRMRDLNGSVDSGWYKSQRGGETVYVKRCVKWPQNYVLSGPSKARVSYNQPNPFLFVSGFAAQIRDESNIDTKNAMLQYFSELFEDANDFSWLVAKNCHAAVCCKMEEDKLDWMNTYGLDRCKSHYAQHSDLQCRQ